MMLKEWNSSKRYSVQCSNKGHQFPYNYQECENFLYAPKTGLWDQWLYPKPVVNKNLSSQNSFQALIASITVS